MEFALILNQDGFVLDILKDDQGLFKNNVLFIHTIDVYSRGKLLNFFKEIKLTTFLNDWELNVLHKNELIGIKLNGLLADGKMYLTGTSSKSAEAEYIDEFSEMNNQQNVFLREQIKTLHKMQSTQKNEWIEENQTLKKEVFFLKKELVERNQTNELLSNEIKNSKIQISKLKDGYWDVSDEIRSSLQLIQRDYEICEQQNEDQIFEIKDILDRYDQVFEEEI